MKKIRGTRAGILAAVVAGTLALGATPVLAIHPANNAALMPATSNDCSSCHSLAKRRQFTPRERDVLLTRHQESHDGKLRIR